MYDLAALCVFIIILFWIVCGAYWVRHNISDMSAMMLAMGTGMIAGVSIGTLMILLYPEYFLNMTVFSMLAAGVIGFFTGISKSSIASLDGMLTGIMGGMMGTMLGMMVEPEYNVSLLKIIGIISSGSLFMLWISIYPDLDQLNLQKKRVPFSLLQILRILAKIFRKRTKEFHFSHISLFLLVCLFYYLIIKAPLSFLAAH